MTESNKKTFEDYLDLIRNGEELTPIELSNAKKLSRLYGNTLESSKATVRRNRDADPNWNDWFYNRFARRPDEEVEND
jgi:hypothetical protein